MNVDEGISTCLSCGISINVSTNPEKSSIKTAENDYKRYNHFCDCLANIQGKESFKVSEDVINNIFKEIIRERMENSLEKLTEADIKRYLKKHRKLRYYNHATQILYRITKIPPLQMTSIMEEKMKMRFLQIQEPFELFKGKNRRNFFSYSYIIYKFCQILGYNEVVRTLVGNLSCLKNQHRENNLNFTISYTNLRILGIFVRKIVCLIFTISTLLTLPTHNYAVLVYYIIYFRLRFLH